MIANMRPKSAPIQSSSLLEALPPSILKLAERIAPNTSKHLNPTTSKALMTLTTQTAGSESYCGHECEAGAMAIVRNESLVIQLCEVLRVMREDPGSEQVIIAPWWPVANKKYDQKVNLFGKWNKHCMAASGTKKVKKVPGIMIPLADLLVWPVELETNDAGDHRIPFTAFHYLRSRHGIDLSHHNYTFSSRGARFHNEVARIVARAVRVSQM